MGGGGGGGGGSTRRPSPPLPAASSGMIDVEAEMAAAETQALLAARMDGELSGAYLDCSRCTTRNVLTATRCTSCNFTF